jgi:hypothetical protein
LVVCGRRYTQVLVRTTVYGRFEIVAVVCLENNKLCY